MSGHSHWAGIKHKKAVVDKKRGKLWSKLVKAIMSAARSGGDPKANLTLQYAIDKAKASSVPKDTIERAILKGSGQLEGEQLVTVQYEGYGPGGAAVVVDALTDNRNRTTPLVRRAFERHAGNLGAPGCVSWNFERKGLFLMKLGDLDEDEVFMIAADAGAEDFQPAGEFYELTCAVEDFGKVRDALAEHDIPVESADLTFMPKEYIDLGTSDGRKVLALMEELEDIEDVDNVYSNFNLSDELMAELSSDG